MKSVIMLWFFIVVIFIVLGLGFAYVIQQQQGSAAGFKAVEMKVSGYDAAIKKLEAQLNTDSENIKNIQNTLMSGETDKKGLNEKIDSLVRQVEEVKAQLGDMLKAKDAPVAPPVEASVPVAAPTPEPEQVVQAPAVELGTIPVAKESL